MTVVSEKTGQGRLNKGDDSVLVAGPITIDLERHEARLHGDEVHFTHRELLLLAFLVQKGGVVVSTDEISRQVWGKATNTNTISVHIKRIREKLGDDSQHGEVIRTVRGVGYRLSPALCP